MLLFLNGVAGSEVFIILLFVLVFFGAKSIPGISRSLGRGIRQIKDASQEIQSEIRKSGQEMKKDLNIQRSIEEIGDTVSQPMRKMAKEIEEGIEQKQSQKTKPVEFRPPTPMDQPQEENSNHENN
ncbi:MAG: Sec-independent protein translocase subunit TatA/TatB [Lishizhenia sp.]